MSKNNSMSQKNDLNEKAMQSLTFWEILVSTLSGAIGVQSNRNRQRDFSRGTFTQFIFAGILFTFLFVLSVTIVVRLVLS